MPDATDRRLIDGLLADGRSSMRDLGDRIGVSATTISKRVRRLEADAVIKRYVPVVDYDALGYDVTAIIRLQIEGTDHESLVSMLETNDRLMSVYEVTGRYDVMIVGRFTTTEEMDAELKRLLADQNVREANSSVALNTIREYAQFPVSKDAP